MKKTITAVMLLLCGLLAASLLAAIPIPGGGYVELGNPVSSEPDAYLLMYPFMRRFASVDIGAVDAGHTGHYPITVKYLFYTYSLEAEVGDRTPPVIEPADTSRCLATGQVYSPVALTGGIRDNSGEVKTTVTCDGETRAALVFPAPGEYTVVIRATDASGNQAEQEATFTVDDPPMIIGAFDRHIERGADFDPAKVVAVDSKDGMIGDRLRVDTGDFNAKKTGDYRVTYALTDSSGLETVKSVVLSVCEKKELSRYDDQPRLTASEVALLFQLDYFAYEPLANISYQETLALIEPTLIDLKTPWGKDGWVAGSGGVYRVTPEYVYFLSVEHVMERMTENCTIMFYNGDTLTQDLAYVTSDTSNEAAMFAVKTSEIPGDTLLAIRQIHYDPAIYDKLRVGDGVVAYATHWAGYGKNKVAPMQVRSLSASIRFFGWYKCLLETSPNVISGMSGTVVTDYKGNLVGLVSAYAPSTADQTVASNYHSMVDVVPELWEKMQSSLSVEAEQPAA